MANWHTGFTIIVLAKSPCPEARASIIAGVLSETPSMLPLRPMTRVWSRHHIGESATCRGSGANRGSRQCCEPMTTTMARRLRRLEDGLKHRAAMNSGYSAKALLARKLEQIATRMRAARILLRNHHPWPTYTRSCLACLTWPRVGRLEVHGAKHISRRLVELAPLITTKRSSSCSANRRAGSETLR